MIEMHLFLEHFEVAWNDMSNEVSPEMGNPIKHMQKKSSAIWYEFGCKEIDWFDWVLIVDLLRYKLLGQIITVFWNYKKETRQP